MISLFILGEESGLVPSYASLKHDELTDLAAVDTAPLFELGGKIEFGSQRQLFVQLYGEGILLFPEDLPF